MNDVVIAPPTALETLRQAAPPGGRVLSVYLDTAPDRVEGQAYLLAYRDGCKALRASLPAEERESFDAAAERVERFLVDVFTPTSPGVAIFSAPAGSYFFVVPLPNRPAEGLSWSDTPRLAPLQGVLDEYERIAVALFDKERARLLTIFLGSIESRRAFTDPVPGKQATGDWFGLSQSRYARHHEDHVRRHVKRTVDALLALLRERPFDRLILGGPEEALAMLRQHLPRPLRARLAGTINVELFASDQEVLRAAKPVAEAAERQAELEMVTELIDAATASHTALGLDETLTALNAGRVHLLLMADDFSAGGAQCPSCGWLAPTAIPCPACRTPMRTLADLRSAIVQSALAQGAKVEEVVGPAADRLLAHGGIGAWTRF